MNRELYALDWYKKYLGSPLYKTARKIGFSKKAAIAVANIPGSFAHSAPAFATGKYVAGTITFLVSEFLCTHGFYERHKDYEYMRKKVFEESKNKVTLENMLKQDG